MNANNLKESLRKDFEIYLEMLTQTFGSHYSVGTTLNPNWDFDGKDVYVIVSDAQKLVKSLKADGDVVGPTYINNVLNRLFKLGVPERLLQVALVKVKGEVIQNG